MARFTVTHSDDACCIDIRGDIRRPEPSTAVGAAEGRVMAPTCPGRRSAVTGALLGICIACAKLRTAAPAYSLQPAAMQDSRRVWVCANWSAG